MRLRSSLFGAFALITDGQFWSCLVPPANPESAVVACQSSMPLNVKPLTTLSACRVGVELGLGSQVALEKPFQSNVLLTTRFASSSAKPAPVPTGPAIAAIANT